MIRHKSRIDDGEACQEYLDKDLLLTSVYTEQDRAALHYVHIWDLAFKTNLYLSIPMHGPKPCVVRGDEVKMLEVTETTAGKRPFPMQGFGTTLRS